MKVLLTGGAGYIGSHTCIELLALGHEVIIVDNYCNSKPEALNRIREISGKDFKFYEADAADPEAMDKVFSENKIDCIIHFAGLKAVGESCHIPLRYYRNNLDSTLTLLETMAKHGVNNIVFSSSATVYGVPEKVPLTEDMPVYKTSSPYGWTKVMSEQIFRDACAANPELSVVLLRYFNPIGAHESGRIGEDPNGIPNNLMPYISQVAIGKLPKLGVFGNDYPTPDGTCVRDYIHVVDLAKGHAKAIEYAAAHKGAEAFNLGTGVGYSVLDIVNSFMKVNEIDLPYEIQGRRDGDVPECYSDPAKAREGLGWTAEKTIEDMCRDTWNWQKKNPKGLE